MDITKAFKNERLLKSLTGLSKKEFDDLLVTFTICLAEDQHLASNAKKNGFGQGAKGKLPTPELKLLFTLFFVKSYVTYDILGFVVGFDRSNAQRNTIFLLSTLEKSLGRKIVMPERKINKIEDLYKMIPEAKLLKDIFVDGVERPVQRPKKSSQQKKLYSGKKKTHTKKTIIITDEHKRILLATPTKTGRRHDKRVVDNQSIFEAIPESVTIWADTGFQGLLKQHKNSMLPKKASKNYPLTFEDRQENKTISGIRIIVEHAIGGAKRYKAFSDIYRNKLAKMDDQLMLIACGLWNLHLAHTA